MSFRQTLPRRVIDLDVHENGLMRNPSTDKLKRKSFLRKSKGKLAELSSPAPLQQRNCNIPGIGIDISRIGRRESIEPFERCRGELSVQKVMLMRKLEAKEERMEKLKQALRRIQTSKSKKFGGQVRAAA